VRHIPRQGSSWKAMQEASCRRWVRIRRTVDLNAAACAFLVTQFVIGAITEFDPYVGLPCFLFYNRVFQLILKVWSACYGVAREFALSDLECESCSGGSCWAESWTTMRLERSWLSLSASARERRFQRQAGRCFLNSSNSSTSRAD
jgi:uncharacterized membrane protein